QVLKSKYEKELVRVTTTALSPDLEKIFQGKDTVSYEALESYDVSYSHLQRAIQNEDIVVNYIVKSQITKRYISMIKPNLSLEKLEEAFQALSNNAKVQKQLLAFFIENYAPIEQSKLYYLLSVNRGNIKALLD